jgi:hypothetical protein
VDDILDVEGTVSRRLSAAQIIVVHRRQIVVNQGIRMNEFHGGGRCIQHAHGDIQRLSRAIDEQGPQALAAA